jgi:hypothetical protein
MTIEFALRRRATQSRYLSTAWVVLAVGVLIGTYLSLPRMAGQVLMSVDVHLRTSGISGTTPLDARAFYCAMGILAFGISASSYACFLLGRHAFIERETAARCVGLADALCIAEGNLESFEKAASLLVPKAKFLNGLEILSKKDKESLVEIVKLLRLHG